MVDEICRINMHLFGKIERPKLEQNGHHEGSNIEVTDGSGKPDILADSFKGTDTAGKIDDDDVLDVYPEYLPLRYGQ